MDMARARGAAWRVPGVCCAALCVMLLSVAACAMRVGADYVHVLTALRSWERGGETQGDERATGERDINIERETGKQESCTGIANSNRDQKTDNKQQT